MEPAIIFLDVNGVLQPFSSELSNGKVSDDHQFSPLAMAQLTRMVKQTGAELVLSSSWRLLEDSRTRLAVALAEHGMGFTRWTTLENIDGARASQVLVFLEEQAPEVRSWVVLDDEDVTKGRDGEAMQAVWERLVRTDGQVGLTAENADAALSILNGSSASR
jgi:hypothetical protein